MSHDEQLKDAILSLENKLRKELLDTRSKALDRSFSLIAIFLTVLTLLISAAGVFGVFNLSQLRDELKGEILLARSDIVKVEGKLREIIDENKFEQERKKMKEVRMKRRIW